MRGLIQEFLLTSLSFAREIAFDTFVNFSKNNVRILILFIHYTVCCPSGLAFTDLARLNDGYAVIGGLNILE